MSENEAPVNALLRRIEETLLARAGGQQSKHSIDELLRDSRKGVADLANMLATAVGERDALQRTFDLRNAADQRAIDRWRESAPDRELTRPDHADLVVWLLEQVEIAPRAATFNALRGQEEAPPVEYPDFPKWAQRCPEAYLGYTEALADLAAEMRRLLSDQKTTIDLVISRAAIATATGWKFGQDSIKEIVKNGGTV